MEVHFHADLSTRPHRRNAALRYYAGLASRKTCSVAELETPAAGEKPRTSHHRSPGGETR